MTDYLTDNKAMWNERAQLHVESDFYDVAGFMAGKNSLQPIELAELGDVAGKSLLHLQCHFGQDTLSWARLGAKVTGADFSDEGIRLAKKLAAELDIPAAFVCADLYSLPDVLGGQFDIVFTSYGVLGWLPDLRRWAGVVAHFLKPGGTFYIVEFHPIMWTFDDEENLTELRIKYPYFPAGSLVFENEETYTGQHMTKKHTSHEWPYTLGDVVTSLIDAGLTIEHLHEFSYTTYDVYPGIVEGEDGLWRLKDHDGSLPLTFSIKATK